MNMSLYLNASVWKYFPGFSRQKSRGQHLILPLHFLSQNLQLTAVNHNITETEMSEV